jgi:hypothetical protein
VKITGSKIDLREAYTRHFALQNFAVDRFGVNASPQ